MASLAEGMAQALMQVKMMKQQDAERAVRDEYLKSQKKILDAQFKALDAENAWWDSQPQNIQKLRHLPKEMQMLGFMGMGLQPPPTVPGAEAGPKLNLQENMTPIPGAPGPGGAPAAPQGGGLPDVMSGLMLRGMMNKMLGFDPGEIQQLRGIAGPGGAPVTLPVNKATGFPMGPGIPEAVKPEGLEFTGPGGEKRKAFVNPYQPGEAQGMVTAPPEIEWVDTEEGGEGFKVPVNKVTKEPVGPPVRTKEEAGKTYELAGKMELAQTGIKEIENLKSLIFNKDGSINRTVLGAAKVNMPFSKGRTMKASFQRGADAIIRAATGAALNAQELDAYEAMYMPNVFDSDENIMDKMIALDEFLNGYLEKMDPTGRFRVKGKASPMREGGGMSKPPKLGGKGGYDYEYIPGQGVK